MPTPKWVKPGLHGAVFGAISAGIVGVSWGGRMPGGGASRMAVATAHDEVIIPRLPICVGTFTGDAERVARLATVREASTFRRGDAVMDAGRATVPGSEEPDRDLTRGCAEAVDLDAS